MSQKLFQRKPKYLITYLCHQCELDFAKTELEQPECFYCGSRNGFTILAKEKLSPEVLQTRLEIVAERMLFNLKKVYEAESLDSKH